MLAPLAFLWVMPGLLLLIPVIMVASEYMSARRESKMTKLVNERRHLDIGDFAKSFNLREVDTWCVRAVYEQVIKHLNVPGLALKANDHLFDDLGVDEEDLSMNIVEEIAQRTGRSLGRAEQNLFYKNANTAGGLVLFFNNQPLLKDVGYQRRAI